ncbi:ABC transporter permease, partial [Opitutaceae bacterium]|nr:ABC transporter permease [Opitutaceae bacterium]
TGLSIACSVMLLLGVERIRQTTRESFLSTVSGTDLVVGARSGGPQLLLQAVFNVGFPTQNLSRESFHLIADDPLVAWTIPLSMGDMHRGFRVVGTTTAFRDHYRFARDRGLQVVSGGWFADEHQAVVGADVARELGYRVGSEVVVSHGAGEISFVDHENHPFVVSGVLAPTGTPVDRVVLVSLAGVDAMHAGFQGAVENDHDVTDPLAAAMAAAEAHDHHSHGDDHDHAHVHAEHEGTGSLSALLVGLHDRAAALALQRKINTHDNEALTAVLPGVALQELWSVLGVVERVLLFLGGFVVVVGLIGMLSNLLGTLDQRRREMAILRSVGARPRHLMLLLVGESFWVSTLGALVGVSLLSVAMAVGGPALEAHYGLHLALAWPTVNEWGLLAMIAGAGTLVGVIPGWMASRKSLVDGLTPRL